MKDWIDSSCVSSSVQVRTWLKESFGANYELSAVRKLLKRMGYTYKQLTLFPSKLDEDKQISFVKEYEGIVSGLGQTEAIFFVDGVHPQHNTHASKVWCKRGVLKGIKTNTGRKRINLNGAYDPYNQQVVIRQDDTINAQSTIALVIMILEKHPGLTKIHLFSDNARYYKCKLLTAFLENHKDRIEWHFLPPYSPNLNLIERLWKYLRKQVINTQYYEKFDDFQKAIFNQIERFEDEKEGLAQFIGTEFHLIKKEHFHFS